MIEVDAVGYRLIIKLDPIEEVTKGGIVIARTPEQERIERAGTMTCTLISVGPEAWKTFGPAYNGKPWAKAGDRLVISMYAVKFFEHPETKELLGLINDDDIIAILRGNKDE